jgi:class 3 adenylate cyclase
LRDRGSEQHDRAQCWPADRRIDFRIGIHFGDIVDESDGDLMGDGVNIAARLEGIAKSGAICLFFTVSCRPGCASCGGLLGNAAQ